MKKPKFTQMLLLILRILLFKTRCCSRHSIDYKTKKPTPKDEFFI
ncbi:hypothetical protein MGSAQ_000045 [marine sediment metagenome]|uniref:Uncharacterized protein n=1 Tax=marine sediment metagenome TaxID=412755 RepID=A0A1B6NYH1_9ZZZZ